MITISNILLTTFLFIILILVVIIINKNKKIKLYKEVKENEIKNIFKERWEKEEQNFNLKKVNLNAKAKEIESAINKLEISLEEKEKRYEEVNQDLDVYRDSKTKEIDRTAAEYEQHKRLIVDNAINDYREEVNVRVQLDFDALKEKKEEIENELELIRENLEIERRKRAAINEEIKRAKEVEEQQDFYKIQLDPKDLQDIELLRSITPRMRHPEAINKVIWTGYYQKPLAELRKRAGIEGSGVYKITRLKTNEIYIGQAVNISTRWTEHTKTALGVGTLASSQLHRTMAEDGPEQFTFEVIEKVEKDKLRERESFYIDFYNSKNYGLNSITGDKK